MKSTAATSPAISGGPPATSKPKLRFRRDIEGLRAVAIILVLLFHAGFTFIPGGYIGVDVFFVISGFLITGLIVREIESTGRLTLASFYARRAKRLLPATVLVLMTTAVLCWFFLPITQRATFGGDIAAASIYVVNWVLASRSVDYLAEGINTSPVQHFWSLAVEEQFYIVWPLVIVAILWVARRWDLHLRKALALGIGLLMVPSFAWSVYLTTSEPGRAYFVTTTRLWELAIGAAVALSIQHWARVTRIWAEVMMGAGLVTIVAAAFLLDASTAWPSWRALYPVLGTALVIAGGAARHRTVAARLLGTRPMVWTGGLSYSLYLWHWPLIVVVGSYFGGLTPAQGALVASAAFIPAWLSLKLIENPVRYSKRLSGSNRLALSVGAACMALGLFAGATLMAPGYLTQAAARNEPTPGDAVLNGYPPGEPWDVSVESAPFVPDPLLATKDVPDVYASGCQVTDDSLPECVYGDLRSERTVVLVGDSMATQWQPAFDALGQKHGFKVFAYLKGSCALTSGTLANMGEAFPTCTSWNAKVIQKIVDSDPDAVITSHGAVSALEDPSDPTSGSASAMIAGLTDVWRKLTDAGIPVVVLAKNPVPPGEVYECVAKHPGDLNKCSFKADEVTARVQRAATSRVPGATYITMNDRICPGGICPAVIGNVLIYRQGSHLTGTYVESAMATLESRLSTALPALVRNPEKGSLEQ